MFLDSLLYIIKLFAPVLVTGYFNYYGFIVDISGKVGTPPFFSL